MPSPQKNILCVHIFVYYYYFPILWLHFYNVFFSQKKFILDLHLSLIFYCNSFFSSRKQWQKKLKMNAIPDSIFDIFVIMRHWKKGTRTSSSIQERRNIFGIFSSFILNRLWAKRKISQKYFKVPQPKSDKLVTSKKPPRRPAQRKKCKKGKIDK